MTAKRFEFREINEPPMIPKIYDTEKQEYANLFECVGWLNELSEENEQLKSKIIAVIDRKIKNNNSNPSKDFQTYSKVNRALKDVRESLRDVIEEY